MVVKRGLARTVHQARQFIIHGHISVNNREVNVPSYIMSKDDVISFSSTSSLAKEDHPERVVKENKVAESEKKLEEAEVEEL